MCDCINVDFGSNDNAVWLPRPDHMKLTDEQRARPEICIDRCLEKEIIELWALGISTTGNCCGHNKLDGYIGVIDSDIPRMKAIGYEVAPNPNRPSDEDSFYPKSVRRL